MIRRSTPPYANAWDLPGGFCEVDEHPQTAAVREVWEETGLRVCITRFLGFWIEAYPATDGLVARTTLNIAYEAHPRSTQVRVGPEATEATWFSLTQLPANLAFPQSNRSIITAAANSRSSCLLPGERLGSGGESDDILGRP